MLVNTCAFYSDGINPPPNVKTVKFDDLAPKLQTGDIVLFTGATSSGAIIRLFDNAEFSHVGVVSLLVVKHILDVVLHGSHRYTHYHL